MFSDEVLDKIFTDKEIMQCPVGAIYTIVHAIERILEEEKEKENDTTISEL